MDYIREGYPKLLLTDNSQSALSICFKRKLNCQNFILLILLPVTSPLLLIFFWSDKYTSNEECTYVNLINFYQVVKESIHKSNVRKDSGLCSANKNMYIKFFRI